MTAPDGFTTHYSYDSRNRLTSLSGLSGLTSYNYDPLSRRIARTLPNGTNTSYTYDAAGRLTSLTESVSSVPLSSFDYSYNALGNRVSATDVGNTSTFTYDALNRLVTVAPTTPTVDAEFYLYDAAGRRLASHRSSLHKYDAANRLVEDDRFLCSYNPNGNLISKSDKASGLATQYSYSVDNQLVRIDFPDGTTARYRYDPRGRRIEKDVNGIVSRYIYDGEDILFELDSGNNVTARFVHGPRLDEPISVTRSSETYFFNFDALGSVVSLTDAAGTIVKAYRYDSFGRSSDLTGFVNSYSFTGREFDSEAGLYYYRSRYYDAETGRFLQEDPIRFAGGSTDLYAYVLNDPLNWVDPFGLSPCGPDWLDWLQTGLDLGGLIPGFGEPLDLLNAAIYGLRGDKLNAGLSAAGAIPFAGWAATGAKVGRKALKNVDGGQALVETVLRNADEWLGPGYRQIDEGVYRSADDTRQFRMTNDDLLDPNQGPHVHFEAIGPDGRAIVENSHVGLIDP
jgi:RHS repeat-associated protein